VNITAVPGQNGFGFATMETPAGSPVFPIIVIVFEFAGFPVGHAIDDVITQVTKSPETGL
jgi:hypothetical protein